MSLRVEIPLGLKDQECERGGVWATLQTPIRYVPEVDPIREKTNEPKTLMVTLPNSSTKTEYQVPVWSGGPTRIF